MTYKVNKPIKKKKKKKDKVLNNAKQETLE